MLGKAFVWGLASPFYRVTEGKWYSSPRTVQRVGGKEPSVPQNKNGSRLRQKIFGKRQERQGAGSSSSRASRPAATRATSSAVWSRTTPRFQKKKNRKKNANRRRR